MGKGGKKLIVGYKYKFGMQVVLGAKPIDRVLATYCDNQILAKGPHGNETVTIDKPTFFQSGEVKDGMVGAIRFHLNGTPAFDSYLQAKLGDASTLIPRFDFAAFAVFSNSARSGPFYIGNSPSPREIMVVAERTQTTCPFGEFALLPYDHPELEIEVNDFNPIVIAWEILIKGNEEFYGDSWEAAAETVYDEGLGFFFYGGGGDREGIEQEICRYVDGRVYNDRQTGLREIQLIRNDFDPDDIPVITEADIIGDPDITWPERSIAANTFTISFSDPSKKYQVGTVTVQDGAHAAAFGTRRGEPIDYKRVTQRAKAIELGFRDCRAQTAAGVSGTVRVSGLRPDLHEGSAFTLDLPTWGISTVVCRIGAIRERGLLDNSVDVDFTEDVFGVEIDARVVDDLPSGEDSNALPAPVQLAEEAPYFIGLREGGTAFTDALADNSDFGALLIAATRANGRHLGLDVHVDSGSGYVETATAGFATAAALTEGCARMAGTIKIEPMDGLVEGDLLLIGGTEYVRVDGIVTTETEYTLTVGRGCIDTAPIAHAAGEIAINLAGADSDGQEYTEGQSLDVKLLPFVSGDQVTLAEATAIEVVMNRRAIRPYPPGRFKVDGSYLDGQLLTGDPTLTWVDRDRLLQVDEANPEDHDDAGIGPEGGTTYLVRVEAFDSGGASLGVVISENVGGALTYEPDLSALPGDTAYCDISVASIRGGYESWTRPTIRVIPATVTVEGTSDGDAIITAGGDLIRLR